MGAEEAVIDETRSEAVRRRQQRTASSRPKQAGPSAGVVRSVDLTDDDIAAIKASEMAPGYEYLNAEVDDT